MELFEQDHTVNLLPYDGTVNYYGQIMPHEQAAAYYQKLLHGISWQNDEAYIFGKHFITKRKVAWYGDRDYLYTYSNATKQALVWTEDLLHLKRLAEDLTPGSFNSCLLNLYHDGSEGMAWHSDDEKSLGLNTTIASLSFGAERKFCFKHKRNGHTICRVLEAGSLLVMKDETQTNWLHRLPPTTRIRTPRINLTFRSIIEGN